MAILNDNQSDWPTSKDTYVDEVDEPKTAKTRLRASIVNGIMKWITNAQDDLGGSLKGSKADAAARLNVRHASDGTDLDKMVVVGANDATTVALGIDGLPTAGGKLFLPYGTHAVGTAKNVPSATLIEGSGYNSVMQGAGTNVMLQQGNVDLYGVTMKDVHFDGNSTGTTGNVEGNHCIKLDGYSNSKAAYYTKFHNLWFKDVPGDAIYLRNVYRTVINNIHGDINWQRIGASLCGRNGIALVNGNHLIVDGFHIRRAANAGIDLEPAIAAESVKKITIANGTIEDCLYGMALIGLNAAFTEGVVEEINISNVVIRVGDKSATGFNTATAGLALANVQKVSLNNVWAIGPSDITKAGVGFNLTNCKNVTLNHCKAIGCEIGLNCDYNGATCHQISIIGGEFSGNYKQGIKLMNASGTPGNYFTVQGVTIKNNGQGTGYSGLQLNYADYASLIGNICIDDQGSPTQVYGITINNSDQVNLVGNVAGGNLTGAYQVYLANCANFELGHNQGTVVFS